MKQPIKKAAAISYAPGEQAPKVIAKGKGIIADKILERGLEADIPVYEDEALAQVLTQMDIGDYIPEALYQVVAEILVFVSDLDRLQDKL